MTGYFGFLTRTAVGHARTRRPRVEPGRTPDRPKPVSVRMLLSFQRPPRLRAEGLPAQPRAGATAPAGRTADYSASEGPAVSPRARRRTNGAFRRAGRGRRARSAADVDLLDDGSLVELTPP